MPRPHAHAFVFSVFHSEFTKHQGQKIFLVSHNVSYKSTSKAKLLVFWFFFGTRLALESDVLHFLYNWPISKVHSLLQLHVVVIDDWSAFSSVHHHPLQTDLIYNKDSDSTAPFIIQTHSDTKQKQNNHFCARSNMLLLWNRIQYFTVHVRSRRINLLASSGQFCHSDVTLHRSMPVFTRPILKKKQKNKCA